MKKFLSIVMCFVLIFNIGITAFAANETNSRGISFLTTLTNSQLDVSSTDQTVEMIVALSSESTVSSFEFNVSCDSPISVVSVDTTSTMGSANEWNANTKFCAWAGSADVTTATLAKITLLIPANTQAGSYSVGVSNIAVSDVSTGLNFWEDGASASTTLNITDNGTEPPAGAFAAAITASPATVTVGDTVTASIAVSGDSFASAEATVTFDSAKLQYNGITGLGARGQVNTTAAGVLNIVDTGESKNSNTYTISFTAISNGTVNIGLTSAAFSTKADAATSDLATATISAGSVSVTINKAAHNVTLPATWFNGNSTVEDGSNYIFTASKWANYDYGTVTYTMGGNTAQTVTPDANGNYTIENVTGALVISMSTDPTPKQYTVTISGDTAENDGTQATYNTDYNFTLPDNLTAGTEDGYTYELASITIDGASYTGYSVSEKTYTIPGTDITGNIVITVTKTTVAANQFVVSVSGNGAGDATIVKTPVNKGADASIILAKDSSYSYTVNASMGGTTVDVINDGNTYTVENITGSVEFTITKALIVDSASATQFVTLDGTQMWLVTIGTGKIDGKIYTYDDKQMFWSDEYSAYCYLVISDTSPAVTLDKFTLVAGTATAIDYGKDVNKTGKVDANDAQFVYNMYNAEYDAFTTDVTIEKFLRADVNGDGKVDMEDASAIVSFLLA